jgi:hypothetical protein
MRRGMSRPLASEQDPLDRSRKTEGPKSPSSFAGLAASALVIAIVAFALLAILDAFTRTHGGTLSDRIGQADKPANLSNYARVVRAASQNAIVVIDEGE